MEHRSHRRHRHPRSDGRAQRTALGRFPLFATCTRAQVARIDALTFELDVPAGRVLAREGARAAEVLFVTAGRIRVTRGRETVGTYDPGSCIGAVEVGTGGTFPATVTTETATTVLVASPQEFRSLLDIPAFAELARAPVIELEPATAPATDSAPLWESVARVGGVRVAADEPWPQLTATVEGTP
jgi:hypothetical protein